MMKMSKTEKKAERERRVIAAYRFDGILNSTDGWVRLSAANRASMGFAPNHGAFKPAEKLAAIVCRQMRNGNWAVSANGVSYMEEAQKSGRIKAGYVVLIGAGEDKVVNVISVDDLRKRLGVPTHLGHYGPYWWTDDQFNYAAERNPF
jgi:hypothetical protein